MKTQVSYDPSNPSRAVTEEQSVGACGLMLAAKRPVAPPTSSEGVQNKRSKAGNDAATSTSITSLIESDSPARQLLPSGQHHRVRVFTQFSELSFFRGLPNLSVAAVSYMDVITVNWSHTDSNVRRLQWGAWTATHTVIVTIFESGPSRTPNTVSLQQRRIARTG